MDSPRFKDVLPTLLVFIAVGSVSVVAALAGLLTTGYLVTLVVPAVSLEFATVISGLSALVVITIGGLILVPFAIETFVKSQRDSYDEADGSDDEEDDQQELAEAIVERLMEQAANVGRAKAWSASSKGPTKLKSPAKLRGK